MENTLRKLQLTQLAILKEIDSFCAQNRIGYSLYDGTLLGAVRHKGFIPWDDDLDICMPRKEYDRFLSLWQEKRPEGYILQNKDNTPAFTQSFTKIRKDHTTFLTETDVGKNYHTGIFVDIFPVDRMPSGKLSRLLFTYRCLKYQLLTREFVPPKGNKLEKIVSFILLKLYPAKQRKKARARLLKKITRNNDDPALNCVAIEIASTIRKPLPADMFDHYIRLPFEDGDFAAIRDWDKFLSIRYGEYMLPPPEDERAWKHCPKVIDFEKNLEELDG